MGWRIKFTYNTGSTFEAEEGVIGWLQSVGQPYGEAYVWSKIEDAQEVLRRMGEHYRWQDSLSTTYGEDLPQPNWWTGEFKPEYRFSGDYSSFNAPGSDGKEIRFYAGTYLGYFETLVSAEVVSTIPKDDKNRIDFRSY